MEVGERETGHGKQRNTSEQREYLAVGRREVQVAYEYRYKCQGGTMGITLNT